MISIPYKDAVNLTLGFESGGVFYLFERTPEGNTGLEIFMDEDNLAVKCSVKSVSQGKRSSQVPSFKFGDYRRKVN